MIEQAQYLRACRLIVANIQGEGLDLSQLKISFKIKKSDAQTPNPAEIRVYNLDRETMNRIRNEFSSIILQAGYPSNYGVIFKGNIKQVKYGRENSTETYIEMACGDGDQAYNFSIINRTLEAGVSQEETIGACVESMAPRGISMGYMGDMEPQILPRGKVMFGMTRDYLRQVSRSSDTTWSIQDGRVQFIPLTSVLPNTAFLLNDDTGLVGIPERTNEGLMVKCLLNPHLKIGSRVVLNNDALVMDQKNKGKQKEASPPLSVGGATSDGTYRILVAEYIGDTRGQDWYSILTCLGVNESAPIGNQVADL